MVSSKYKSWSEPRPARRGGCGPGTGRGSQAPGREGGPDRVADGEGQAEP